MLAALWLLLALSVLVAAGYSHYRYRVKNNQYYARLYSGDQRERASAVEPRYSPYAMPTVTLVILCLTVPAALTL